MSIVEKASGSTSSSTKNSTDLSVLIPVYNEEEVLEDLKRRLKPVLEEYTQNFEVIFIDDGSTDNSAEIIKSFSEDDRRLKGIKFARNFGQHAALSAGLKFARGSQIVTMDADLQNPPEEIPKLLKNLSNGHDLVWGIFESRHHSGFRKAGSALAKYILSKMMSGVQTNISTFRAIDGKLVKNLNELNEQSRFLDGLLIWLGANPKAIAVQHAPRAKGKTKYSFFRLIRLWFDLLTSFSDLPLKFATFFGIVFGLIGIILALYYLSLKFIMGFSVPGFATIIIAILVFSGIQLFCLGMLGEYVSRIFKESKKRPFYVVRDWYGLNDK